MGRESQHRAPRGKSVRCSGLGPSKPLICHSDVKRITGMERRGQGCGRVRRWRERRKDSRKNPREMLLGVPCSLP